MKSHLSRLGPVALAILLVSACTSSSSGGSAPTGTGSASVGSSTGSTSASDQGPAMPAPVYDAVRNFSGTGQSADQLRVRVYPLQRVAGALLLTVDFTPQSANGAAGFDHFDSRHAGDSQSALRGASLVDTAALVRYGPLRSGSTQGEAYSSNIESTLQKPKVTYRIGGFFPDPGPSVTRMAIDLQLAGLVPDVPISTDPTPPAGLVRDLPGASPAPARDDLVIWPVTAPAAGAFVDRHELVAQVAGGTANESHGLVTVNADVLFAFDSATLTPRGTGLVRQAATTLVAKADPGKPIRVVGYTDAKGTPSYNTQLSTSRATAVTQALTASGVLSGYTLRPEGRGEARPVAANTLPGGADNPSGRALNRRVEIWYTPKTATTTPAATTSSSPQPPKAAQAAPDPAAAATVPRASLAIGPGSSPVWFQAQVYPVIRTGQLALVNFDLTLDAGQPATGLGGAFSSHNIASTDFGDIRLEDPATKRAYIPAYDGDDDSRVMCTYTARMDSNATFRFSCLTAGLPDATTMVSVRVGALGTATAVPVQ